MNREEKNIGSIIIFIVIILVIAFGGYYLINNKTEENEVIEDNQSTSIKIDDSKDYIYFTNEESLSKHESLNYKDINININSDDAKKLQDELNNQMNEIKNNVIKISDNKELNISSDLLQDDIYEAEMIDYVVTLSDNYLSLEVNNYIYRFGEGAIDSFIKYYVFDLSSGNLLSNRDILSKENISDQQIRSTIREYVSDDESVDIDATLASDYSITVSAENKIIINATIKTSDGEYIVNIEM